jgi:transcriptional regulator with XRE-family HTH domain
MGAVASISDRVGDLGGYLREQREHAKLSVRQLATLAGVSNPYLSQVERGLRRPSAEVLQQIAKGLRISAEALYVRAGILDEAPRQDVEAAVQGDVELTERQKRVLLDIYASFRAENARARVVREAAQARTAGDEIDDETVDDAAVDAAVEAVVEAVVPAAPSRRRSPRTTKAAPSGRSTPRRAPRRSARSRTAEAEAPAAGDTGAATERTDPNDTTATDTDTSTAPDAR